MSGGKSKVYCYKKQYCIGTWNIKFIKKGKLDMVKQEMARVNIDVNQNRREWVNLIQITIMFTALGQESFGRNGIALKLNKNLKCSTWVQFFKWQNDLGSFPRQII